MIVRSNEVHGLPLQGTRGPLEAEHGDISGVPETEMGAPIALLKVGSVKPLRFPKVDRQLHTSGSVDTVSKP